MRCLFKIAQCGNKFRAALAAKEQVRGDAALDVAGGLAHLGAMKRGDAMRAARWVAVAAVSAGLLSASGRGTNAAGGVSARMARLPRVTVWAWERREDLRGVDARTTAVAYLERTVEVDGSGVRVVPRRQAMLLPAAAGLVRIAVVRIEVASGTELGEDSARVVAEAVSEAATNNDVAALQVDFDARQSQREWYATVLRGVRAKMPAGMPLSMTALASWCSYDGAWMRGLPVDEAVPMLFRMEPDRRRAGVSGWGTGEYAVREPMCMGSVGISTREAWPVDLRGRRVYVFADRGWARDGLEETVRSLQ